MARSRWRAQAQRKWGRRAAEISGDGQFALLAPCWALTITLWSTRDAAEEFKKGIDQHSCGDPCNPRLHHIVDLLEATQLSLLPQP